MSIRHLQPKATAALGAASAILTLGASAPGPASGMPTDARRVVTSLAHASPWAPRPGQRYRFRTLDNPADPTFNTLTGINNSGIISGYDGSGTAGHPSKGYTLAPPYRAADYANVNVPKATQTQVTGIDNLGNTAGNFGYVNGDLNYGFVRWNRVFEEFLFEPLYGLNNSGNTLWTTEQCHVAECDVSVYALNHATGLQLLFTTVGTRDLSVNATGINDGGDVVGSSYGAGEAVGWAVLRDGRSLVGDSYEIVYPSGSRFYSTIAIGISSDEEIVGTYYDSASAQHGFILTGLLTNPLYETVDDPNGVGTTTVNAVNDKGDLVGTYVDSTGNVHGFLATRR